MPPWLACNRKSGGSRLLIRATLLEARKVFSTLYSTLPSTGHSGRCDRNASRGGSAPPGGIAVRECRSGRLGLDLTHVGGGRSVKLYPARFHRFRNFTDQLDLQHAV